MKLALVGCRAVGTWSVPPSERDPRPWERDDRFLHEALSARGVSFDRPAWDDPDIDWGIYDIALLRATWDYHHRHAAFLAFIERVSAATRLVNPAPVVRWNAHKGYLRDLDVPQPPTLWLPRGSSPDLRALLAERSWSVALVKPAIGATSEGSLRVRTDETSLDVAIRHTRSLLEAHDVLVQPYVAAVEDLGERSAIAIGGKLTHFVRKMPNAGDWRVQDDYGATDAPHDPDPVERAFANSVLDAVDARFGPLPYARIDWLMSEQGPWLIELELIEPCLFFRHGPHAATQLAELLTC